VNPLGETDWGGLGGGGGANAGILRCAQNDKEKEERIAGSIERPELLGGQGTIRAPKECSGKRKFSQFLKDPYFDS
jgi:hypothetical protein